MRLAALIITVFVLLAMGVHGRFGRVVAFVLAAVMAVLAWFAMSGGVVLGY